MVRAAAISAVLALALLAAVPGGAAERGSASTPYFGYNEEWDDPAKFSAAASGGADISRVVVSWSAVERRPGQMNWEGYDLIYERLVATGLRPVWVLADAPCWAWSKKSKRCSDEKTIARPPTRKHDDDWAAFAAELVERYPETVAIQSWNEPNLVDFWKPRPNPERAAEITAAANEAVKEVDPDVTVLFGGLAPLYETIPKKREIAYDEFLRDAYKAVGRGHWDAVAMHPFPRFRNRDGFLDDIEEHLGRVRVALKKSKARGTPIWVTEIGLSTTGPFPYTPEQQAEGLVRIYERLSSMPDVPAVIVHRLVDVAESDRAEAGWGVVRSDGEPKPAYCALAQARGRTCPPGSPPPDTPPAPPGYEMGTVPSVPG